LPIFDCRLNPLPIFDCRLSISEQPLRPVNHSVDAGLAKQLAISNRQSTIGN
jgi:hypothetical protein